MSVNYIPHQHDLELANRTIQQQAEEIARLKAENSNLRNELRLKCGGYLRAHMGACNGCKWGRKEQ